MTMSADDDLQRKAERRVAAKLAFRSHLVTYLLVNAGLVALNLVTSPGYPWCLWVIFGWGIGLASHGLAVYGGGDAERDRMIQIELARLRRTEGAPPR